MIVHLNGWPGVGKQTIGRVVAERLGARFLHNHVLHDVAIVCTGISDPARWELYEEVRAAAYARLRVRPPTETFVMTNALSSGRPREVDAWNHVVDLAIARKAPRVPIVLTATPEENERRLVSSERSGRKLTDVSVLRDGSATDSIQLPIVAVAAGLDVTRKSPEAAAADVIRHLDHVREAGLLTPATDAHRRLAN